MQVLNALTVDVEDYFHVAAFANRVRPEDWDRYPLRVDRNTRRLLEILAARGVVATFFVLGWVAERCPSLIRDIAAAGHEIGCHSYAHRSIYQDSQSEFHRDLRQAKRVIEDILGRPVKAFRAPSYSITKKTLWALEVLREEGFEYDSSIFPIVHDLYGIPGAPRFPYLKVLKNGTTIKEFPPSTIRFLGVNFPVAGGGYLRLLPYWMTAWAIRRINHIEQQPGMVYIHPWEIDSDQPRIPSSWVSRFRQYQNLGSTETKLRELLQDFSFGTIEQALSGRVLQPAV